MSFVVFGKSATKWGSDIYHNSTADNDNSSIASYIRSGNGQIVVETTIITFWVSVQKTANVENSSRSRLGKRHSGPVHRLYQSSLA